MKNDKEKEFQQSIRINKKEICIHPINMPVKICNKAINTSVIQSRSKQDEEDNRVHTETDVAREDDGTLSLKQKHRSRQRLR